jgi:ComF family protein
MCADCWAKFNWISNPKCSKCGYPFPANFDLGKNPLCPICASGASELDFLRSACVYDEVSRDIMLPFKHASKLQYKNIMARAMISVLSQFPQNADLIIPVPLAHQRLWKRGYNQAAVLALPLSKYLNVKTDFDSVTRKYRPDMGHKNARQRAENIRGVFSVIKPDKIRGKNILLVDDVMTTGATFSELYKVLKKAGAKNVYGITFCRVVRAI